MDIEKLRLASALLQTLYDSTEAPGYLNKEDNLRVISHIQELLDEVLAENEELSKEDQ